MDMGGSERAEIYSREWLLRVQPSWQVACFLKFHSCVAPRRKLRAHAPLGEHQSAALVVRKLAERNAGYPQMVFFMPHIFTACASVLSACSVMTLASA